MVKAQAKVLGALRSRVRPVRGASEDWGRSEREHRSVVRMTHVKQVVGDGVAEPLRFGRRPVDDGEVTGRMQPTSLPAYWWRHQSNGRRSKAGKVSRS